jgi:F-type H+-transporting ATPase subunit epsilon
MSDRHLQCVVVTPEKAVLDESAESVVLPMFDGELGVLVGRAPLIGRLGAGELRIVHHGRTQRFFVDGGFAQVRGNVVTVLTSRAIKASEINTAAAAAALEEARKPVAGDAAQEAALKAQDRARAQLRMAGATGATTPAAH